MHTYHLTARSAFSCILYGSVMGLKYGPFAFFWGFVAILRVSFSPSALEPLQSSSVRCVPWLGTVRRP